MSRKLDDALDNLRQHLDADGERVLKNEAALLVALRGMLESKPEPAWLKLIDGRMVYINKAYSEEFGVYIDEYGGGVDYIVWPADVASAFMGNDKRVVEEQRAIMFQELVTVNGKDILYWILKWPVYVGDRLIGVAGESRGPVHE